MQLMGGQYSIASFWTQRLGGKAVNLTAPLPGWAAGCPKNPFFVEAAISRRASLGTLDAPVWFVAAPGAVGKSTLARVIAATTGAVYVDLAAAATVAGNYVTGGLVKSGLHSSWSDSTILLDALDEARLRVTDASFCDFLSDVVAVAHGHSRPIVLFGRVGVVEEAWFVLTQSGIECPIFDIDFFTEEEAWRFTDAALRRLASRPEHTDLATRLVRNAVAYQDASRRFVSELRAASVQDGDRFAGYAPVLEAIAALLAGEGNPGAHRARARMRQDAGDA